MNREAKRFTDSDLTRVNDWLDNKTTREVWRVVVRYTWELLKYGRHSANDWLMIMATNESR
jgi:hypothetical protein